MSRLCIWLIRGYRRFLSRLKPTPTCRFTPTCSQYAIEAFERRGFLAGLALTVWRILRCSPLSPGGYDPVPETGFRTMPFRWSRFRRNAREAEDPAGPDPSAGPEGDPPPQAEEDEKDRYRT